jgi:hypothetical protein
LKDQKSTANRGNKDPTALDKMIQSLRQNYQKTKEKIQKISTQISISVNRFIFDTQTKIDRYRLTRRYNRKKREEEKAVKQAQEDLEFESKKVELQAMEVKEILANNQSQVAAIGEEVEMETTQIPQEDLSADDIKKELDKLETEEYSESIEEKLTRNPLKLFSIIQLFVGLLFLAIGVITTQFVTKLVLTEEILALYALIIGGAIFGMIFWRYIFNRFYPRFLHILIQKRFTRKLIAGGSFSFYEHKDPLEERIINKITEPIGMIISTLITLLALATTVIGVMRFVDPDLILTSYLLWGVLVFIIPVISTPILPVIWGLQDARVKSYNKKTAGNWLVSTRYKMRFNSLISAGAILSNLMHGSMSSFDSILEQLQILYGILSVGIFITLTSVSILVLFYYIGFRKYLRTATLNSLDIKTFEINLIELEISQFKPKLKNANAKK